MRTKKKAVQAAPAAPAEPRVLRLSAAERQQLRQEGLKLMLDVRDTLRRDAAVSEEDLRIRVR